MDHLLLRAGRRSLLLAAPQESSYGKVVGFGNLIRNVYQALEVARQFDAAIGFIRPRRPMNEALFELQAEGVRVLPSRGGGAWAQQMLWGLSAPFRRGAPGAWLRKVVARPLRGLVAWLVRRSRTWPKARRLAVKRLLAPRQAWAQRVTDAYAARIAADWRTLTREAAKRRRKARRKSGQIPLRVHLLPARERLAADTARSLGLGDDTRVVTLHVRESGYRPSQGFRQRESDRSRTARIEDYGPAIDFLVGQGFSVVRIGDPTMTPFARPGLVDLATSPLRNDWVEFWCLQRSRFFIACDSGPLFWAELFNLPRLTVNLVQYGQGAWRLKDRFVPKLAADRSTGRRLSLADMLTERYVRYGRDPRRYEHLDNTPEDLLEAVQDMLDVVEGDEPLGSGQRRYQERLSEIATNEWRPEWKGPWSITIQRHWHGRISRRFAERYFGDGAGVRPAGPQRLRYAAVCRPCP